jgi:hypothetical protein
MRTNSDGQATAMKGGGGAVNSCTRLRLRGAKRRQNGGPLVKLLADLAGRSTGPREMRDMLTMKRSKRHHGSVKN